MKIYQYFRKSERFNNMDMNVYEKYPLYAVTESKKHAKMFETSRSPNAFIKRVQHVDKDDGISYINKHRGNYLQWYDLDTFIVSSKNRRCKSIAKVLMTDSEAEYINVSKDSNSYFNDENRMINPDIFKDKIFNALELLGYTIIYAINPSTNISSKISDTDISIDIEYDELQMYINMINDQLNPNGFDAIIKIKKGEE